MEETSPEKCYLIVYSSDKNASYFMMSFSLFEHLLLLDESGATGFLANFNEFTVNDFRNFNKKIKQLDEKDIEMTEAEMIITVVALHHLSVAFINEEEENQLIESMGEEHDEFIKIRNKILDFTTYVFGYVNDNISFDLLRFWNVMKRLETSSATLRT